MSLTDEELLAVEEACEDPVEYACSLQVSVPALLAEVRALRDELSRKNDALATLTRLDEREACATVAESYEPHCESCPRGVANAIRTRGSTPRLLP